MIIALSAAKSKIPRKISLTQFGGLQSLFCYEDYILATRLFSGRIG